MVYNSPYGLSCLTIGPSVGGPAIGGVAGASVGGIGVGGGAEQKLLAKMLRSRLS